MKTSRTAHALSEVERGMTVQNAAKKWGISRQSIYRLIKYRAKRKQCPVCGSLVPEIANED